MLRFTLKLTSYLLWFHRRIYLFVLGVSYPGFSNTNSGGTNYSITDFVISFRKKNSWNKNYGETNSGNSNSGKINSAELPIPEKQTPKTPISEKQTLEIPKHQFPHKLWKFQFQRNKLDRKIAIPEVIPSWKIMVHNLKQKANNSFSLIRIINSK